MSERSFLWGLENHQRSSVHRLMSVVMAAKLLCNARVKLRRYHMATEIWERVVDPAWKGVTRVEAVEESVLIIGVRSTAYLGELQRQAARLGKEIATLMAGVQRIRFVQSDANDGMNADRDGEA